MRFRKRLRFWLERLLRFRVYWYAGRTHGHRITVDILGSGRPVKTIFDVGANIGQSAIEFHIAFPDARLICFEPVAATFLELQTNFQGTSVESHRLGMSNEVGEAIIHTGPLSTVSSIIPSAEFTAQETVNLTTIDTFSAELNIGSIDLLKIDTEGYDLIVLEGARKMLKDRSICFIQIEVGFHPEDKRHVLIDDVRAFLVPFGYSIFGIYDQMREASGELRMRYANAVFSREYPHRGD